MTTAAKPARKAMTPAEYRALADEAHRHVTEYADKDYPSITERYARFATALNSAAEQAELVANLQQMVLDSTETVIEQAERLEAERNRSTMYAALVREVAVAVFGNGDVGHDRSQMPRLIRQQAERLERVEKALTLVRSAIRRTPGHRGVQFSGKDVDMIDAALRGEEE